MGKEINNNVTKSGGVKKEIIEIKPNINNCLPFKKWRNLNCLLRLSLHQLYNKKISKIGEVRPTVVNIRVV